MKRMAIVFAAILGIAVLFLLFMNLKTNSDLKGLVFSEIDMDTVADGIYRGKAETTFIKAEVEAEAADHRIISISILQHDSGLGGKAEQITSDMVRMNTFDVDVISGATASSKVLKSAVSDALAKGQPE
jgi:uncharacterized protein with FMN-binding domain